MKPMVEAAFVTFTQGLARETIGILSLHIDTIIIVSMVCTIVSAVS